MSAPYFRRLNELFLGIQITDREDSALSFEEGTTRAVAMTVAPGRKAMLIGNGGSAAIASHMQNDLCKTVGVRAIVFNEPPLLTAISNDHGYEVAFERLVELWADPGDLLVAISSSGQSENILRAVRASLELDCKVITFSGFNPDNPLRKMGEINFYVPSDAYGEVEAVHTALCHFLTDQAAVVKSGSKDFPAA